MKCHPLLYSGTMVRAYLAGLKDQTRRIVAESNSLLDGSPVIKKPKSFQRECWEGLDWDTAMVDMGPSPAGNAGPYFKVHNPTTGTTHRIYPRIQPGDTIYGKEAFDFHGTVLGDGGNKSGALIAYKADGFHTQKELPDRQFQKVSKWQNGTPGKPRGMSPFFMMPELSRILQPVFSVRAERVQDISEEDAKNEGIERLVKMGTFGTYRNYLPGLPAACLPQTSYMTLWDSINGPGSWKKNPCVWVYSFPRHGGGK